MRGNSTVGDLKRSFCHKMNLNPSETRLLLNGDRLDNNSPLHNLKMENSDVIEVFSECRGGGPPGRKVLLNSDKQILDALNNSTDSVVSDECNFEFDDDINGNLKGTRDGNNIDKLSPTKEQQQTTLDQQPLNLAHQPAISIQNRAVQYQISSAQKTETSENESLAHVSQLVTSQESTGKECQLPLGEVTLDSKESNDAHSYPTDLDIHQDDVDDYDDDWLEALRSKFDEDGFPGNSSLHKKLKFYLEIPKLTDAEKNIVKQLKERIKAHSVWEMEKQKIFPPKKKPERKRKKVEPTDKNPRCSKRRQGYNDADKGLVTAQEVVKSGKIIEINTRMANEQEESNPNSTPKQRKTFSECLELFPPL